MTTSAKKTGQKRDRMTRDNLANLKTGQQSKLI